MPLTRGMARPVLALLALAGALACGTERVETVTLTPTTPAIADVLRAADARWEAAGVDPDRIRIGEGGAPVRLVPDRAPIAETRIVKRGRAFAGVRWVELFDLDVDIATHELGHALGIEWATDHSRHLDEGDCTAPHAERPLMCAVGGGTITAADLALACDVGACAGFEPEG